MPAGRFVDGGQVIQPSESRGRVIVFQIGQGLHGWHPGATSKAAMSLVGDMARTALRRSAPLQALRPRCRSVSCHGRSAGGGVHMPSLRLSVKCGGTHRRAPNGTCRPCPDRAGHGSWRRRPPATAAGCPGCRRPDERSAGPVFPLNILVLQFDQAGQTASGRGGHPGMYKVHRQDLIDPLHNAIGVIHTTGVGA
jgi:hypothetical protein